MPDELLEAADDEEDPWAAELEDWARAVDERQQTATSAARETFMAASAENLLAEGR